MCNWQFEANGISMRLAGASVYEHFPPEFTDKFPPSVVRGGHCLGCGKELKTEEMYPPGKTPRYMCEICYQKIIHSGPRHYCLTCGDPLPLSQIKDQRRFPRELRLSLHEGPCADYHAVLAGIVLGVPFNTRSIGQLPPAQNTLLPPGADRLLNTGIGDAIRQVNFLKLPR